MRTILLSLALLLPSLPSLSFAQNLPGGFTCQDLIDTADGKASRSYDGGRTYVPVKAPRPTDAFGQTLLAYDTYLCRRLARGEITASEFDALHAEKSLQLKGEKNKVLVERQALQNQQRILQQQQAAIQNQREAVEVQRRAAEIQAQQGDAALRQREAQHQELMEQQRHQQRIQQQQLEAIRQEQIRQEKARPKSFSCFGGANYIHCN